jgi:hypothetical protein
MKFAYVLAAVAAFAVVVPAVAADKEQKKEKDAPKEKKICRTEMVTGSLIAKRRICLTAAEWDEMTQNYKHSMDDYASRASGLPGTPANPREPR